MLCNVFNLIGATTDISGLRVIFLNRKISTQKIKHYIIRFRAYLDHTLDYTN